ncbi:thioredoxin domain protein [Gregarina niphandrodes]|uniref:Pre-mRNA-splicing factor 38 n=1 Tax=Gregarina niphandrodes TaxID=110365 RepID=A0A023BDW0_GRENI|nr:thioredoxin domain protein [Gregarina niphandrodes]EZG89691.1 thioredoxin domain protein [Gregarina niphandrodes]|eukprot:XP_011128465.1 thioredoxin domain protein [Gregarina niphandrodes]
METSSWLLDVPMCHLHPKPLLSCKFCRKYKTAVHQQAKLAQLHERAGFGHEKTNTLEMTNTTSYNLNPMLKENILVSEYYKSLYQFTTVPELIDEVVQYVDHVEPHVTGHLKIPSTFACCLYKLFNLRCTEDEMLTITEHPNLFVRTLGFVWLRFVHPPEKLWQWFETVVLDDTDFRPTKNQTTTFGEFAESLLKEDRYFNTPLPRLPAKIRTHTNKFVVVDFAAEWCGPCKLLKPVFDQLAEKHTNVVFASVDVDQLEEVADTESIQAMPTIKLFANGTCVETVVGANKDNMVAAVAKLSEQASG